jgi:serine/threonine protein kinase
MQLAPGARLGPYEITAAIGEGGMGQVYKAKDTRLDRTVAIKILPALLAADRQFRERFDREARAVSQLDHPHICPLHDVGEHDGTSYLVMPFLDGETLEQRLQRGPIKVAEAVQIATQIADALARAHSIGIIHRDLKPANIMLTRSGARLLDFGLAKTAAAAPVAQLTQTQPARLTTQGTIIGTFHYMSPEQVEGADGDARTDVWGFGCVLYEMLTGARAFDGKSTASVLANILHAPVPPVRDRQPGVGRAIDHVVQRCLEKDPDARWQSMADVVHELRWASAPDEPVAAPGRPIWKQPTAYAVAFAFAAAGYALSRLIDTSAVPPDSPQFKLALVAPAGLAFTPFGANGNPHYALSPDGSRIAYVAAAVGRAPSLWVQRLDARTAREIPGSHEASAPFWSSDSQSVAFFSEGKLKRSGLESERSQVIATTDAGGGTWNGDVILIGTGFGPIMRIPASGGQLSPVTAVGTGEVGHRWPQFLGDGRHFIYVRAREGGFAIGALGSTASAQLRDSGSTPVAVRSSHVLFVPTDSTTLQVQALDLGSQRLTGQPRDILESVRSLFGSGYPPASVSATGLVAYWDGTTVATDLNWYDRNGTAMTALPAPADAAVAVFAISPNGGRLAWQRAMAEDGRGFWLMERSGIASRVTVSVPGAVRPIWSHDGASLWFTAPGAGSIKLMRRDLVGGGEHVLGEVSSAAMGDFYANDWSRDGNTALLSITQLDTGRDIVAFSTATGRTRPFVTGRGAQVQPRFSPDQRWVAYTSNETGRWEVFVESFQVPGSRHQVSSGGGSQPIWRRDGAELFYVAPDGKLMAMTVTPGERWVPANPRALFATRMRPLYAPYPYNYDVSSDGQRFLIREVQPGTGPVISIVTGWRPPP